MAGTAMLTATSQAGPSRLSDKLRDMLEPPIRWDPPVHQSSFTNIAHTRVVSPDPPSPPRTALKLLNKQPDDSPRTPASKSATGPHRSTTTQGTDTTPSASPASSSRKGKEKDESPRRAGDVPNGKEGKKKSEALHGPITELGWPDRLKGVKRAAAGLRNPSMACYCNATLQILLHTPPLHRIAASHDPATCRYRKDKHFCMLCTLRLLIDSKHWSQTEYRPMEVHQNLGHIKKGFNVNKQEDAHEFFRFVTDSLQATALYGQPKNLTASIKHTTWVHQLWGGQVRSRVLCSRCQKPSDTFDHFLDISLDMNPKMRTLHDLLQGFIREDRLEGENKYRCDNCKAKADATKSFRIAQAPPILTFHLKRFRVGMMYRQMTANKFTQAVDYPELLNIAPFMINKDNTGTKYRLFGVTCHIGSELRFGHYVSYVRGPSGKWYRADDDDVSPVPLGQVQADRNAYLLSYIRISDEEYMAALKDKKAAAASPSHGPPGTPVANGHSSPLVKRPRPDTPEQTPVKRPFIPSPAATPVFSPLREHNHESNMSKFGYKPDRRPEPVPQGQFYGGHEGQQGWNNRKKSKRDKKRERRENGKPARGAPMPYKAGANAKGKVFERMRGRQ